MSSLPEWVTDQIAIREAEKTQTVKPAPYACECGATHCDPQSLVFCRSLHRDDEAAG
jgi:hypothetical protein